LKVGFKTDRGRLKLRNEDSLHVDSELGLFIIADGLGGHKAGEVASSLAVTKIAAHIGERVGAADNPVVVIEESILYANQAVCSAAELRPELCDMGSTAVLALFRGSRVWISHVGDSRAYLINNETIKLLTQDHTFVAEWLRDGLITAQEARTHRARHGLFMALGVADDVHPETFEMPWDGAGLLLLCSDGLHSMLEDREILEIVKSAPDPQQACEMLVRQANRKGGEDNITVILVGEQPPWNPRRSKRPIGRNGQPQGT
jgi:protein phosphatase